MKAKALFALAGASAVLIPAMTASAAIVLDVDKTFANDSGGTAIMKVELWIREDTGANFTLEAIFGDSLDTLSVVSSDGSFQNYPGLFGAPSPTWSNEVNSGAFGLAPDLEWDTYAGIGGATVDVMPVGSATPQFTPGFPSLSGSIVSTNGSWFLAPGNPNSDSTSYVDGRIFIGQFTVLSGATVSGNINVQGSFGQVRGLAFSTPAPAPGSLALLGLAGLAGMRRRRRA